MKYVGRKSNVTESSIFPGNGSRYGNRRCQFYGQRHLMCDIALVKYHLDSVSVYEVLKHKHGK